jgi:hypothetical protein
MLCYLCKSPLNKKVGKVMFENVINEEAIEALTEDQVDTLLAMFEEAGY